MWCDNCLLVFPLRAGAIAWNCVIVLYSILGGFFLLWYGEYLFFFYPEWFIYGGIALGVAVISIINILAYANRSIVWTRACNFLWPFIIVIMAIRAIIMIVELGRYKSDIQWECDNGHIEYGTNGTTTASHSFPSFICTPGGASTVTAAFIVCLLVDIGFEMYAYFLNWRYVSFLRKYQQMQGPFYGGYYG